MSELFRDGRVGAGEFITDDHGGADSRLLSLLSSAARPNHQRVSKETMQAGKNDLYNRAFSDRRG